MAVIGDMRAALWTIIDMLGDDDGEEEEEENS